jgi:hypothetical protein
VRKVGKQYGDSLVCVRYRYDEQRQRRYSTVELIIEESPWQPEPLPSEIMEVRVEYG